MIAIVDYGIGNLRSVQKAFESVGASAHLVSNAESIRSADKVVLPGVGAFKDCVNALQASGLTQSVLDHIKTGQPFLGICVGMQLMFEGSQESPGTRGLGVLAGECERFPANVKSPHVGWNSMQVDPASRLFRGIPSSSFVYFTHSFRAPIVNDTVACCEYGGEFSAAVEHEHLFGVQFHPEKSGNTGLKLLANFCAL